MRWDEMGLRQVVEVETREGRGVVCSCKVLTVVCVLSYFTYLPDPTFPGQPVQVKLWTSFSPSALANNKKRGGERRKENEVLRGTTALLCSCDGLLWANYHRYLLEDAQVSHGRPGVLFPWIPRFQGCSSVFRGLARVYPICLLSSVWLSDCPPACLHTYTCPFRGPRSKGWDVNGKGWLDELAVLLRPTNGSSNIVSGATSGCTLQASARTRGTGHTGDLLEAAVAVRLSIT